MRKAKKEEKKQEENQTIEITKDVKINEDTVLEAGDKIEILGKMEENFSLDPPLANRLHEAMSDIIMQSVKQYGGMQPDPSFIANAIADPIKDAIRQSTSGNWGQDFAKTLGDNIKHSTM